MGKMGLNYEGVRGWNKMLLVKQWYYQIRWKTEQNNTKTKGKKHLTNKLENCALGWEKKVEKLPKLNEARKK